MEFWVRSIPYDKEIITFALERGVSTFWVPEESVTEVKKLGRVTVVANSGDVRPGVDFMVCEIKDRGNLEEIESLPPDTLIYIEAKRNEIIPLENLVAMGKKVIVPVKSEDDLRVFSGVLEKGVWGILFDLHSPGDLSFLLSRFDEWKISLDLRKGVITEVTVLGLGDRVCVDTCTLMRGAVGMLVGNSSRGFFLVSAENVASEYVSERPFRVNAGAVHMYTLLPSGRTGYLSEISAGSQVLTVGSDGTGEVAWVGRSKIEKRPLILVKGDVEGREVSAILQNAETIRLVSPQGEQISIADIRRGTEVMCYLDDGARHFGMKIEETVEER
ncbi:MAG: 3-dehydroquinate synthase II [Deltaproteobacteria bacterium]|nr:3-dehydroquinate synthase II [Deltaproteobacteria bacterium]NIS77493.1 3-dehydroquinate synthase II [Deltaproteobacteria bacterium]